MNGGAYFKGLSMADRSVEAMETVDPADFLRPELLGRILSSLDDKERCFLLPVLIKEHGLKLEHGTWMLAMFGELD